MIARRLVVAGLVASALTAPLAAEGANSVRIATEGQFPPFNALRADGTPKGFEIDLGNAACAHAGLQCTWIVRDWSALIPGLAAGEFDVVMAAISITPERRKRVDFTREYFVGGPRPEGMFVGGHSFLTPADALIAVQAGTIHEDHLRAAGYRILPCDTAGQALDAVLDGRADLVFGSPDFLENRVYRTSRMLSIVGRAEIEAGGAAAALAKGNDTLRQSFDAAFDALDADGTIETLRKKWFMPEREI